MHNSPISIAQSDSLMNEALPSYNKDEKSVFHFSSASFKLNRKSNSKQKSPDALKKLQIPSQKRRFKDSIFQKYQNQLNQAFLPLNQARNQMIKEFPTLIHSEPIKIFAVDKQAEQKIKKLKQQCIEARQNNEDLKILVKEHIITSNRRDDTIKAYEDMLKPVQKSKDKQNEEKFKINMDKTQNQIANKLRQYLHEDSQSTADQICDFIKQITSQLQKQTQTLQQNVETLKQTQQQYDEQLEKQKHTLTGHLIEQKGKQIDDQIENQLIYQRKIQKYIKRLQEDIKFQDRRNVLQ